jgi:2,3-bisphosphoglycerate-dependent phosphoglycerate mutase
MTTLVLVRHCQSAPDPALPERDWPLSEKGRAQAVELAAALADLGVDALASSPYIRAVQTLQPYADHAGLPIVVDEDLRERNLGGWIEKMEDVEAAVRRMLAEPDFHLEGGESGRVCLARFQAALARVVAANPGCTVAVGSHGGILAHLLTHLDTGLNDGFWSRIKNPHILVFDARDGLTWVGERTFAGAAPLRAW